MIDDRWCVQQGMDVVLKIFVQPKSKKAFCYGIYSGMFKLSVREAPHNGHANDALIKLLMGMLKLKRHDVIIRKGLKQRAKIIVVKNASADVQRALLMLKIGHYL